MANTDVYINVRDAAYGAVGDGYTDDTDAINLAIADLPTDGGRIVFPPGNYVHTGINLDGQTQIILEGEHSPDIGLAKGAAQLTYVESGTASAISLRSARGITIRNLAMRWSSAPSSVHTEGLSSPFEGYLVDLRKLVPGSGATKDTAMITLSHVSLGTADTPTNAEAAAAVKGSAKALVILDGSHK